MIHLFLEISQILVNTADKNSSYHKGNLGALTLSEAEEAMPGFGSKQSLWASSQRPEKQDRINVSPADIVRVSHRVK